MLENEESETTAIVEDNNKHAIIILFVYRKYCRSDLKKVIGWWFLGKTLWTFGIDGLISGKLFEDE